MSPARVARSLLIRSLPPHGAGPARRVRRPPAGLHQTMRRALAPLLLWALATAVSGCGPDVEERIAGPWIVDADRWLADPSLTDLSPDDRAPLQAIARGLVAEVHFDFGGGECRRSTAGRVLALPCRIHAVEQGVVVLRATASDGAVHWIRVKPEGATARVTWGGRTLPLRRPAAVATSREAEK